MNEDRVARLRRELFGDDLTVEETATILGMEKSTVLRYLKEHLLIGYKLGRKWHVPEAEIRRFVQERYNHDVRQ